MFEYLSLREKMRKIRIIFADDHVIVRDGLRSLIKSDPQFSLVGEAADGQEALELVSKLRPDVAMLDISMPRLNGIEATRMIKRDYPSTRVMILTIHENEQYVYEMLQAGADGYLLKNAEKTEIFDGLKAVTEGEHYFSSEVSKLLIGSLVKKSRVSSASGSAQGAELTGRE
jgi:two-component system response regulator NreC